MHNWFECKVTYEKTLENGMEKKVTEPYLVDALSFTEAEARIIEELRPFIKGEFEIADIKRARLSEIFFHADGDKFYRAKVQFITLDEKSGSEKKTSVNMLAQASDFDEALHATKKGMQGTMADYVIASLVETTLVDVFPYDADKAKEPIAEKTLMDEVYEDPLIDKAAEMLTDRETISTSQLARSLSIAPERASAIMRELEKSGLVGPFQGASPRKVIGQLQIV